MMASLVYTHCTIYMYNRNWCVKNPESVTTEVHNYHDTSCYYKCETIENESVMVSQLTAKLFIDFYVNVDLSSQLIFQV